MEKQKIKCTFVNPNTIEETLGLLRSMIVEKIIQSKK